MPKFRKKPVIIEAIQFNALNPESMNEIEEFVRGDLGKNTEGDTIIATLEGALTISHRDWIIKGINGEFYPCKPDIFEKTYELVEKEK